MNAKGVTQHYGCLTPQERFRLILAASGRNDEAERERLVQAGGRVALSLPDHSPYAMAFSEVSYLTFMELVEDAARYFDAWDHARQDGDAADGDDNPADQGVREGDAERPSPGVEAEESDDATTPRWLRAFDLALAYGYILRTKAEGWKRFCEQLNVLPFLMWEPFPGFERLRHALATAEEAAFAPEGFLRWLNTVRPEGKPEQTELSLNPEKVAATNEAAFRERVRWWDTRG